MEKSYFFNAVVTDGVADRTYSAEDLALREAWLLSDGVIGGDSLMVEGLSGYGVHIGAGAACISGYTYINTDTLYLTVAAGHAKYDRIDTVALKLDLSGRRITATVISGTPGVNPVRANLADTDTVKYLPLADVYVGAGSAPTVENEDITDRRTVAGHASAKESVMLLLKEYLGEIDPVDSWEISRIREVIGVVNKISGENTVLCGDGVYRKLPAVVREIAAEYAEPGEYVFTAADHPSETGYYDIEVQGAGGGGGSHIGEGARGGGGGAGAFLAASGVRFPRGSATVKVGMGGAGVPGGDGADGEASSIGGFAANGGFGGRGGAFAAGGMGGIGMCLGGNGADGDAAESGEIYTVCGKGGDSFLGDGSLSAVGTGSVGGIDADFPGAGGSGGTSVSGTFGLPGGRGGDGRVTVYRYTVKEAKE